MDKIILERIPVSCLIGTRPEERLHRQPVVISVTLECDFRAAAASDDLRDTVNYVRACERVKQVAEASEFFLLERLGGELCRELLALPGVAKVGLRLEKPLAIPGIGGVALEMERGSGRPG